ncbi:hypothetical protein GCM10010519_57220 [Streptomyces lactacystinicus]
MIPMYARLSPPNPFAGPNSTASPMLANIAPSTPPETTIQVSLSQANLAPHLARTTVSSGRTAMPVSPLRRAAHRVGATIIGSSQSAP